jgi:hypothetical protein
MTVTGRDFVAGDLLDRVATLEEQVRELQEYALSPQSAATAQEQGDWASISGWVITGDAIRDVEGRIVLSVTEPMIQVASGGYVQSDDYDAGTSGFQINGGTAEFNDVTVRGTVYASAGEIGGWTITSGHLYAGTGASRAGMHPASYPFYAGDETPANAPFRVTPAGALTATDATVTGTVTAAAGAIGGWTIGATTLTAGSIVLNSATPAIMLGAATAFGSGIGIFEGNDGGTYKWRVGNPGGYRASWDGTTFYVNGSVTSSSLNPAVQEWTTDIVFSSTDNNTVSWTSGTIQTVSGLTYSINSGNTGNMSALTYIFLDVAVSTTALQVTTTYSNAVGDGRILVAAAQNHSAGASVIPYGGQQPIINGTDQITALSIVAGNIAAGAVTATKISVSHLSAISANMGTLTAGEIRMYSGTWDSDATGFRLNSTEIAGKNEGEYQFYVLASDGCAYAGGGNVGLSSDGIYIVAGAGGIASYNKLRFVDGEDNGVGYLTARYGGEGAAATTFAMYLVAYEDDTDYDEGSIIITAYSGGGTNAYVALTAKDGGTKTLTTDVGTATFGTDVRVGSGLYVGSTGTNPAAGTITATDYIVALGGLHVGGTADPGTDNLLVDGYCQVSGEVRQGGTDYGDYQFQTGGRTYVHNYGVFMGGVHVGGTADPGTDNLIVDGKIYVNESSCNDVSTGIVINMGAASNAAFAVKNSNVAHNMTDFVETNTYGTIEQAQDNYGGLQIRSFTEGQYSFTVNSYATTDATAKTAAAVANILLIASKKSGTGAGAHGANANLVAIRSHASTRFLFDAEGEMHSDAAIGAGNDWDGWEDLKLAHDVSLGMAGRWDETLRYSAREMEKAGLLRLYRAEDGVMHAMIRHKAMHLFHNCVFRDVYNRFETVEECFGSVDERLMRQEQKIAAYEAALIELGCDPAQLALPA